MTKLAGAVMAGLICLTPYETVLAETEESADVYGKTVVQTQGNLLQTENGRCEITLSQDRMVLEGLPEEAMFVEFCSVSDLDSEALKWLESQHENFQGANPYVIFAYDSMMNPVALPSFQLTVYPSGHHSFLHYSQEGKIYSGKRTSSSSYTFMLQDGEYLICKTGSEKQKAPVVTGVSVEAGGLLILMSAALSGLVWSACRKQKRPD